MGYMAYGERLRTHINARQYSVREFAGRWADVSGRDRDYCRVKLYSYFRGTEPQKASGIVEEHAAALEIPVERLTAVSDDDEESDFVAAVKQLQAVAAALAATAEKFERQASSRSAAA